MPFGRLTRVERGSLLRPLGTRRPDGVTGSLGDAQVGRPPLQGQLEARSPLDPAQTGGSSPQVLSSVEPVTDAQPLPRLTLSAVASVAAALPTGKERSAFARPFEGADRRSRRRGL